MRKIFRYTSFIIMLAMYTPLHAMEEDIQLVDITAKTADLSRLHGVFCQLWKEPEGRRKYIQLGKERTLEDFITYMQNAQGKYNDEKYNEALQLEVNDISRMLIIQAQNQDWGIIYLDPQWHSGMLEESIFLLSNSPKGLSTKSLKKLFSKIEPYCGKELSIIAESKNNFLTLQKKPFHHTLALIKQDNISSLIVHIRAGMSFCGFMPNNGGLEIMLVYPPLSVHDLSDAEKALINYEEQRSVWENFGIQNALVNLCDRKKRTNSIEKLKTAIKEILK